MSARERRRLVRIGRQLALARIERRESIGELADAIAEEVRSRHLAERSRRLAADYATPKGIEAGADLAGRVGFVGALSRLAGDAEASGAEAAHEADTRKRALAAAERRIERLESHEAEARRAVEEQRRRRAGDPAAALARKLQRRSS